MSQPTSLHQLSLINISDSIDNGAISSSSLDGILPDSIKKSVDECYSNLRCEICNDNKMTHMVNHKTSYPALIYCNFIFNKINSFRDNGYDIQDGATITCSACDVACRVIKKIDDETLFISCKCGVLYLQRDNKPYACDVMLTCETCSTKYIDHAQITQVDVSRCDCDDIPKYITCYGKMICNNCYLQNASDILFHLTSTVIKRFKF